MSWSPQRPRRGRVPSRSPGADRRPLRLEVLEERNLLSFLPPVNSPAGTGPTSVAVADFDGDGLPDLAVTNYGTSDFSGSVSVLLGNGDGSFRTSATLTGLAGPRSLAVGDFNNDGNLDIAEVGYFLGTNEGASSSISIYLGNGDGTFQPRRFVTFFFALSSVVAADFNGDGNLDLAVTKDDNPFQTESSVTVFRGNGDATFQPLVTYYLPPSTHNVAALGDFNGDGIADLAVAQADDNSIAALLGYGDGSFRLPVVSDAGPNPVFVTAAGSGLVVVNGVSQGTVSILPSNGDGTFGPPQSYDAGPLPTAVAAADFNGDGIPDLAATNSQGVRVLLGAEDGSYSQYGDFTAGSEPSWVVAADLDGDGLPDLAVTNFSSGNVSVLLNDGDWPSAPGGGAPVSGSGDVSEAGTGSPKAPPPAAAGTSETGSGRMPLSTPSAHAARLTGVHDDFAALAQTWLLEAPGASVSL